MAKKNKKEIIEKCTVLIIDDDPAACKSITDVLEGTGFLVTCAGNGAQAKKLVVSTNVDVILLDLKLPDSFGLDLIKFIRKAQKDAEIIVITAHGSLDSSVKSIKEGVSDFFMKPYDPKELIESVKKCAEKQNIKRELEEKMDALEDFSEIATGRELKMVELKEEIENLKNKLKNCRV